MPRSWMAAIAESSTGPTWRATTPTTPIAMPACRRGRLPTPAWPPSERWTRQPIPTLSISCCGPAARARTSSPATSRRTKPPPPGFAVPARSKSVKRQLSEYLAAEQPPAITEALWENLLQRFAPISESYLRELLRATGLPFEQPCAGIRQHTFEELEQSLREMLQVYAESMAAGDRQRARYCRRQVIGAKDLARFQARSPGAAPEQKSRKAEMVQWMLVWLENPEVFPAWVEARLRVAALPNPSG